MGRGATFLKCLLERLVLKPIVLEDMVAFWAATLYIACSLSRIMTDSTVMMRRDGVLVLSAVGLCVRSFV